MFSLGLGYMPEAITEVVDWALTQPWVSRIWAACDVENYSSTRALERPDSPAKAFCPTFQFIPTSRQLPVIATPMRAPAVLNRDDVQMYRFSRAGAGVYPCLISCRTACFARYCLRRA